MTRRRCTRGARDPRREPTLLTCEIACDNSCPFQDVDHAAAAFRHSLVGWPSRQGWPAGRAAAPFPIVVDRRTTRTVPCMSRCVYGPGCPRCARTACFVSSRRPSQQLRGRGSGSSSGASRPITYTCSQRPTTTPVFGAACRVSRSAWRRRSTGSSAAMVASGLIAITGGRWIHRARFAMPWSTCSPTGASTSRGRAASIGARPRDGSMDGKTSGEWPRERLWWRPAHGSRESAGGDMGSSASMKGRECPYIKSAQARRPRRAILERLPGARRTPSRASSALLALMNAGGDRQPPRARRGNPAGPAETSCES